MTLVNVKPSDEFAFAASQGSVLLIACGALAREIVDLIERNRWALTGRGQGSAPTKNNLFYRFQVRREGHDVRIGSPVGPFERISRRINNFQRSLHLWRDNCNQFSSVWSVSDAGRRWIPPT